MKKIGLIVGVCLLGLTSCNKAELKKPVDVNFSLDLDNGENESGPLKLNIGELNLGSFNVSGDRLEGDDIEFVRSFTEGLRTDLNGSGEVKSLDYQIPQGEYSSIILDFSLLSDGGLAPSLFIEGTYKPDSGPTRAVRFEFFENLDFMVEGEDVDGASIIIMDKKIAKKVEVYFNPIIWFETISSADWDNASLISQSGQDLILINSIENSGIYEEVSERLSQGVKAIFK
jgi:hypothetical protein